MSATKPPEFLRRALQLVAIGEPVAQIARGLRISGSSSTLRQQGKSERNLDYGFGQHLLLISIRPAKNEVSRGYLKPWECGLFLATRVNMEDSPQKTGDLIIHGDFFQLRICHQ